MTPAAFNAFCKSLPHTTHVVQWGGADVWKIGGKVFAIAWAEDGNAVTFKCSDMSYELLKELPGCRPAPYLASRGMKWIQRTSRESVDDRALKDYLKASYTIVSAGLPRKTQAELGIDASTASKTSKPKPSNTKTEGRRARP